MSKGGQKAPTPYQPAQQPQADAGYQQLVQNNMPWATALPGQVIPGMNQAAQNVVNDPYAAGAQAGANQVSTLAGAPGGVANSMLNSSNSLQGLGDVASAAAGVAGQGSQFAQPMLTGAVNSGADAMAAGRSAYDNGGGMAAMLMGMVPGATAGAQKADGFYNNGMNNANTLWGQTQAAIPGLTGGMPEAQQLLNNGFDPQSALYDRQYQKMQDQQNAINSMYGVAGSPYGAGVAGDASRNFNLDWQNNQLSRQIAALGAYGQQSGQVTSNLSNLLNTGASGYGSLATGAQGGYNDLMNGAATRGANLINSASGVFNQGVDNYRQGVGTYQAGLTSGATNYNNMMNGAVDRFGNMVNTAGNAYGQASGQGVDALNTLTTASQLPNQTYLQQQQAVFAALQSLANGAGSAMNPTTPLINAEGNYLNIGQQATTGAQNAVQINNAAKAAQTQALMQGLGTIAGIAMAPSTGGASLFSMAGAGGH